MPNDSGPSNTDPLAVITGASSGIGQVVVELLAQRPYRIIVIARRTERLEALQRDLRGPATIMAAPMDLADPQALSAGIARLVETNGPVDLLVNNAGFGLCLPFLEHRDDQHHRLMQVNYLAPLMLIRAVLPGMVERGQGHVINVASIATKIGPWGHSGYAAAKGALVALTQSLACEYAGGGVHFSYVNPGVVQTEFFNDPSYERLAATVRRRGIKARTVAKRIVRLIDSPRLETCVPTHYRVLDLLKAISPGLALRLVSRAGRPDGR